MSKKRADRPNGGRRDDDDDKKQQPNKSARLDHSGMSLATESTVAAAASSASALPVLPPLSPAQRLYSDALISVFGFLDLAELISAHASCRSWQDAAHKEPSRSIAFHCDPARLAWFSASALRHHVGEYLCGHSTTLGQLASLRSFPALVRVRIGVAIQSVVPLAALHGQAGYAEAIAATVAQWPSRLTHLNMGLFSYNHKNIVAATQVLIDCIGRIRPLSKLELWLPKAPEGSLTLQPLLQLTQLQTLHLGGHAPGAAQCSVLKQMSSLTHLNLELATPSLETLQALSTPPHQLSSLQRIDFSGTVTAAHMEALARLPAISTLQPMGAMDLAAAAYLPRFPQLRTLRLWVFETAAADFMPHLTQCTQITALSIQSSKITLADLTELTRTLTALTTLEFLYLTFEGLEHPTALACLRSLPQLRELTFHLCSGVRLAHLTDPAFTSLSSLRSLSLFLRTPATDYPEACALFTVPCALMPQLTYTCIESDQ